MNIFILILVLIIDPNNYPSRVKFTYEYGRPLNIAHRGLCSILPDNTLEAFQTAMYSGADFIELDIVYSKDRELIVMHDPYLSNMTNVAELQQFKNRKQTRIYAKQNISDWWTDTFTLTQLKQITLKQVRSDRSKRFNNKYTFNTLEDIIKLTVNFNKFYQGRTNPDKRLVGIIIEAKNQQMYHKEFGLSLGESILQVIYKFNLHLPEEAGKICPVWLQSFYYQTIKYWAFNTYLPINYLIEMGTQFNLTDISLYVTGVGVEDTLVWEKKYYRPTAMFYKLKELNFLIHIWTFRDDALIFGATSNLEMYHIAQNILEIDGVITDFAHVFTPIAQLQKNKKISFMKKFLLTIKNIFNKIQ